MALWTPGVTEKMLDQRDALAASLVALSEASNFLAYWNRRVKEKDPYVQVIKAREGATASGMKGGYYHLLRIPPDGPPSIIVHEGPNGEFREPDEGLVRRLEEHDLWNPRVVRDKERQAQQAKADREADRRRDSEERRAELKDRYRHRFITKIPVSRDV